MKKERKGQGNEAEYWVGGVTVEREGRKDERRVRATVATGD